jgi:hypothetical protein
MNAVIGFFVLLACFLGLWGEGPGQASTASPCGRPPPHHTPSSTPLPRTEGAQKREMVILGEPLYKALTRNLFLDLRAPGLVAAATTSEGAGGADARERLVAAFRVAQEERGGGRKRAGSDDEDGGGGGAPAAGTKARIVAVTRACLVKLATRVASASCLSHLRPLPTAPPNTL